MSSLHLARVSQFSQNPVKNIEIISVVGVSGDIDITTKRTINTSACERIDVDDMGSN